MSRFEEGDLLVMTDRKGRRFLVELRHGKRFSTHRGTILHDDIIGVEAGHMFKSNLDDQYVAMAPRLADYVLLMKRGAQIIYPKDAAAILVHLDVRPGSRVFEAGTGSGALTLFLLDAVGPSGKVTSVDIRPDHSEVAEAVIRRWHGGELPANLDLRTGSAEDIGPGLTPDRVMLDMAEPWHAIAAITPKLPGGAVVGAYLPTIPQVETTVRAMRFTKRLTDFEIFEVLHRDWNVEGRSVRPAHRMVGHTGFLVVGRSYTPISDSDACDGNGESN